MRGSDRYCITTSGTNEEMWLDIRNVLGPVPSDYPNYTVLMNEDIAEYNVWTATVSGVPFDKWLIWKLRVGTDRYGNLPANKTHDGKVGHCWNPCPYSTQSSDLKTRLKLGLGALDPLPVKVDHTIGDTTYLMKTTARGARWGYECTFPGCTYPNFILIGEKYFFV